MLREREVTAADCSLCLAIPLEKAEFLSQADRGAKGAYIPTIVEKVGGDLEDAWREYSGVADYALSVVAKLRRLGGTAATNASMETIGKALRQHSVVTLIAHGMGGESEADALLQLHDETVSPQTFATVVPEAYSGVLDLTSCRSGSRLLSSVKSRAKDSIVMSRPNDVHPLAALTLYSATLTIIAHTRQRYTDAMTAAVRAAREAT